MSKGALIVAVILVVMAGVFAWIVGQSLEGHAPEPATKASDQDDRFVTLLRSIDERLARIEKSLDANAVRTSSPAAPIDRTALESEAASVHPANMDFREMIAALRELNASLRSGQAIGDSHRMRRAFRRDIDWSAWQDLWARNNGDKKAIRDELLFLPQETILERFGPPEYIDSATGRWTYSRVVEEKGLVRSAWMDIQNGLVVTGGVQIEHGD